MARPIQLGEGYRGEEGPVGYLLRQTIHAFNTAMENGLRRHRLTSPQFGALFVTSSSVQSLNRYMTVLSAGAFHVTATGRAFKSPRASGVIM